MKRFCIFCNKVLSTRHQIKYCSNSCQFKYQRKFYIEEWKRGKRDGNKGVETKNISGHIKEYFLNKYLNKCSICGWNKKHPITKKVPLELDHIDGNSNNNSEENLRILCPNCHALTPHFRNLNRGKGRKWRVEMIRKNK